MAKNTAQPEVSIGLFGHVDHGKTTLVRALTGKWTGKHSEELKRGITIRLGYADALFYKCKKCKDSDAYSVSEKCKCGAKAEILRHVSFVDAPGHESLMATMLAGATIIDGALLMVSAAEKCPQPQTIEHLMALDIMGIKNVVVVQNKIDLVDEERALKNYGQIKEMLKDTFPDAPIIPISAQHGVNVDVLIQTIEEIIKTPKRETKKDPIMLVARSFDVNKPGSDISLLVGGVLGGTLRQGILKLGDEVEILPGYEVEERNKKIWKPIFTKISLLMAGDKQVKEVVPGGSIAVGTTLDPAVAKSDKLVGAVVGKKGKLPPVLTELNLSVTLLKRVVGMKENTEVEPIRINEVFMLNVNSSATVGFVKKLGKNAVEMELKRPVCAEKGARVTISRRLGNRFRLIGYGIIQ